MIDTSEISGQPAPPEAGGSGTGGPAGSSDPGRPPASPSPRRLRSFLIGSAIAAVLAVFLFVGLGRTSGSDSGSGSGSTGAVVAVGDQAPGFTLPSLTGGTAVDLDALGKDAHRPVVLNFFASWCIPCQQETPLLARTADAERAKGSDIQFVGVDVADPAASAIAFVKKSGLAYPIGADAEVRVTSGLYGLDGEPNTFFVNASGTVIGHKIGALDQSELDGWLAKLGRS